MIKLQSFTEVPGCYFALPGKVVVDAGCGTGDLVRWMTNKSASVIGVDTAAMIARAEQNPRAGEESYLVGSAEELAFGDGSRALLTYFASLHHGPRNEMPRALGKCLEILKPGGAAIFLGRLEEEGSHYEIVRLVDDETEIRALAYNAIKSVVSLGFRPTIEEFFYVERSFADYQALLEVSVDDAGRRSEILEAA
jgi:ubiquinone/menaquinone biosynthesis C-methylase UbiE